MPQSPPREPLKKVKAWTPEAVAEAAGFVKQTIYRQIHMDPSPFPNAFKIGQRKWLIPEEDVFNYFGYDPSEVQVNIIK